MTSPKPLVELEHRPVEAPSAATPGARVFVLLPTLEELVRRPGFGRRNPICLPDAARPFDPWTLFGRASRRGPTLH